MEFAVEAAVSAAGTLGGICSGSCCVSSRLAVGHLVESAAEVAVKAALL